MTLSVAGIAQVRCYFVEKCVFENPNASETETDMALISEKTFMERCGFSASLIPVRKYAQVTAP